MQKPKKRIPEAIYETEIPDFERDGADAALLMFRSDPALLVRTMKDFIAASQTSEQGRRYERRVVRCDADGEPVGVDVYDRSEAGDAREMLAGLMSVVGDLLVDEGLRRHARAHRLFKLGPGRYSTRRPG